MVELFKYSQAEQRVECYPTGYLPIILSLVAKEFQLTEDKLLAPNRCKAWIAEARQIAMYLANVECAVTMTDIAKYFRRDRTTVSYACAKIEDRRDDDYFDQQLEQLTMKLQQKIALAQSLKYQEIKTQGEKTNPRPNMPLVLTKTGRILQWVHKPE